MATKEQTKSNSTPVMIIVFVLLAALVVGGFYYMSSKSGPTTTANKTNTNKSTPAKDTSAIPANAPAGAQPPDITGGPNAAVVLEEFADFQCPSCGQMHPIMKQIQSIYGTRIKFIFRNFPLPMHDKAYDAAVAAEAAGLQGPEKFWAMHNQLYTNQQTWSADPNYKQLFKSYAEKSGVDVNKWETDVAGLQAKTRVDADLARGRAIPIGSTPTLFIDGKMVPYPDMNVQTLRQLIDAELAQAASQQQGQQAPAASAPPAANGASK